MKKMAKNGRKKSLLVLESSNFWKYLRHSSIWLKSLTQKSYIQILTTLVVSLINILEPPPIHLRFPNQIPPFGQHQKLSKTVSNQHKNRKSVQQLNKTASQTKLRIGPIHLKGSEDVVNHHNKVKQNHFKGGVNVGIKALDPQREDNIDSKRRVEEDSSVTDTGRADEPKSVHARNSDFDHTPKKSFICDRFSLPFVLDMPVQGPIPLQIGRLLHVDLDEIEHEHDHEEQNRDD